MSMSIELPRVLYHPVLDEVIVKNVAELAAREAGGYSIYRKVRSDVDAIREGIKNTEKKLAEAKARLAQIEKGAMEARLKPAPLPVQEPEAVEVVEEAKPTQPPYVCEVCGKEVASAIALSGHMRSHKK